MCRRQCRSRHRCRIRAGAGRIGTTGADCRRRNGTRVCFPPLPSGTVGPLMQSSVDRVEDESGFFRHARCPAGDPVGEHVEGGLDLRVRPGGHGGETGHPSPVRGVGGERACHHVSGTDTVRAGHRRPRCLAAHRADQANNSLRHTVEVSLLSRGLRGSSSLAERTDAFTISFARRNSLFSRRVRSPSLVEVGVGFRVVAGFLAASVGVAFDDELVGGGDEPVDGGLGEERVGHHG